MGFDYGSDPVICIEVGFLVVAICLVALASDLGWRDIWCRSRVRSSVLMNSDGCCTADMQGGMAPVHAAASRNDVEALAALLDGEPSLIGAWGDIPLPYVMGQPLHFACYAGSVEAAQLLLDRGAGVSSTRPTGERQVTPLMLACKAGRAVVASLLLARGADPTITEEDTTVLIEASCTPSVRHPGSDHVAVIRLLLEDGRVSVDARDEDDRTALWHACERGYADRVRVLLFEGRADHTIADYRGYGPLEAARGSAVFQLIQMYEDELEKPFVLSRARALVDATESIRRAMEKVGARRRAQAQRAREEAAPAYLRGRVVRGEQLPVVVVGHGGREKEEDMAKRRRDEECQAVCEFVVRDLKEDLVVEMMEGLMCRRWAPEAWQDMVERLKKPKNKGERLLNQGV